MAKQAVGKTAGGQSSGDWARSLAGDPALSPLTLLGLAFNEMDSRW